MREIRRGFFLAAVVCWITLGSSYSSDSEAVKIRGLITNRTGETLTVNT